MFIPDTTLIFTMLLLWLLIAMITAPLEALGWWAGWFDDDDAINPSKLEPISNIQHSNKEHIQRYLVYLTGISGVSGEVFLEEEIDLLKRLDHVLEDIVVVDDVYPYSVSNQALTGQRVFAWFWRFALNMKLSGKPRRRFIGLLINMRNAFQVSVSADRRYGPIYNVGSTHMIMHGLLRHGYQLGSGIPVTLLGYSGGGQIALGAVPYLTKLIGAPVTVISLGGVLSADPGIKDVEHLYHIYGKRDGVQRFGLIVSPSRWRIRNMPILPRSRWNKAREAGKMTFIYIGNMKHNGAEGYLDNSFSISGDERTNIERTIEIVTALLQGKSIEALALPDRADRRTPVNQSVNQ